MDTQTRNKTAETKRPVSVLAGIGLQKKSNKKSVPQVVASESEDKQLRTMHQIRDEVAELESKNSATREAFLGSVLARCWATFPNPVEVVGKDCSAKVVPTNRYSSLDLGKPEHSALFNQIESLGYGDHFAEQFTIKVESAKIPVERHAEVAQKVAQLFDSLGLSSAVSYTSGFLPKAGFHEARPAVLGVDGNAKLQAIYPAVIQVKLA